MRHFGRTLGFIGLLAILVAFGSSDALAQKKKDKDKDKDKGKYPAAMDADYKAIQKQKELFGKLVSIDGANVTLRVEYPHSEANPKYSPPKNNNPKSANYNALAHQQAQMWRTYNDIMQQQQNAAKAKNPQEYQRAMNRAQQDMARLQIEIMRMNQQIFRGGVTGFDPNNQPFIIVSSTKDFELELKEKVVLRKLILPFEYDDVGNPKTYTDKEKAELRGDDKSKPGYMAKLEDFRAGQEIKLSLTLPKKKEVDKEAEKEAKELKAPEEIVHPIVTMVVLLKDSATTSTVQAADEKKKKK